MTNYDGKLSQSRGARRAHKNEKAIAITVDNPAYYLSKPIKLPYGGTITRGTSTTSGNPQLSNHQQSAHPKLTILPIRQGRRFLKSKPLMKLGAWGLSPLQFGYFKTNFKNDYQPKHLKDNKKEPI